MTDPLVEQLRQRREALRLSRHMVARAVGVTRGAVWMWERGDRPPDLPTLRKWATALGLDLRAIEFVPVARRPHGTYAAAVRHRRGGELPCEPCGWAERNYWAQRKRAARSSTGRRRESPHNADGTVAA